MEVFVQQDSQGTTSLEGLAMKQLINFCPVHGYKEEIDLYPNKMSGFLKDTNLDGIELYVYDTVPYEDDYSEFTTGVHLKYWPYWLDFWQINYTELLRNHNSKKDMQVYFCGAENREQWLDVIRKNIIAACDVKPEYLVWHVSHCGLAEYFTRKYIYTDEQIIDSTIEVFNEISSVIPKNVKVLFENLWWPGLTLLQTKLVDKLFTNVNKDNVGIMLDTGHLMNTNMDLKSEAEAIHFIKSVVKSLGSNKDLIKGMHFSCSLSGEYQKSSISSKYCIDDMREIFEHIAKIDQHRVFKEARLKEFIEYIAPEYLIHELFYDTMSQVQEYVKHEQSLMKQ